MDRHLPSDLCEEHKLQPSGFSDWPKRFYASAEQAFSEAAPRPSGREKQLEARVAQLEAKLARKDAVINEHNAHIPRDHWLQDDEKLAIIAFHDRNPMEGYRRLAFMMLDEHVAAVSPSSVYRLLVDAGRMARWNIAPSKKGTGFEQPLRPGPSRRPTFAQRHRLHRARRADRRAAARAEIAA